MIGDVPGAYEQAFKLDKVWDDGEESDVEIEPLVEGRAEIKLSKETKARIREPWAKAFIFFLEKPWAKALMVKVFGRTVRFNYLNLKINALCRPTAKMDHVNLGKDYFLIRFHSPDYDNVLKGGPWFVGEHFLAIKPWEPYFRASGDNLTSVAIWVRFSELPIEFYDLEVLKEIGSAIGPVLRIDSYTANGSRGSYARLCIQVDIDRPLIKSIRIGSMVQQVLYEGISSLCFCCGRLGHKQENCYYQIKQQERRSSSPLESPEQEKVEEKVEEKASDQNYRPWMLVTRKKNLVRNGQAKSDFKDSQDNEVSTKGKMVFRGINSADKEVDVMVKSPKADFPHSKQGQSRVRLDVSNQNVVVEEQYLMNSRQVASGSGIEFMSFQSEGVRSNFALGTNNKSKKNLGIKGSKSLKRQHPTSNPKTPSHHLSLTSEYGSHFSGKELSTSNWVGDLASRKASKSV